MTFYIHSRPFNGLCTVHQNSICRRYCPPRSLGARSTKRRSFSSSSSSSSTTTTSSSKKVTPKPQPPRVISRRSWQDYKQKNKSLYDGPPPGDPSKKPPEEKPWPQSVVYTGYFLAATMVPYFCTWFAISNDSTRPYLLSLLSSDMEKKLRIHFGSPEWSSVPYPEQIGVQESALPHALLGEMPLDARENQERIAKEESKDRIVPIRVRVFHEESGTSTDGSEAVALVDETMALSLNTPATPQSILPQTANQLPVQSCVTVEFPIVEEEDEENSTSAPSLESETVDPLLNKVNPYSLWHYHPVADPAATQKVSFHVSEMELKVAELQDEISYLEDELRRGNSHRSVDQIMADIDERKSRLRRLQWRKWLPW